MPRTSDGIDDERLRKLPAPLPRLIRPFVADLQAELGQDVVGVDAYGSAITGGFDAEASDLDLAIVTRPVIDEIGFNRIAGAVDRLAARERRWADHLDLVFVGAPTLASFRDGGPLLSISHDEPLQRLDAADDWLQTWYLVRESDCPLVGPSPRELIPEISTSEFVAAVAAHAGEQTRDTLDRAARGTLYDASLSYIVLTFARVLRALDDGVLASKTDAAHWLAARRPALGPLLDAALEVRQAYLTRPYTDDERAAALRFVREAGAEIEARRKALPPPARS